MTLVYGWSLGLVFGGLTFKNRGQQKGARYITSLGILTPQKWLFWEPRPCFTASNQPFHWSPSFGMLRSLESQTSPVVFSLMRFSVRCAENSWCYTKFKSTVLTFLQCARGSFGLVQRWQKQKRPVHWWSERRCRDTTVPSSHVGSGCIL